MNFSRMVRNFRKRLKLSRLDLARLADLSYSTIGSYEAGSRKPTRRFLQKLAEIERAASSPAGVAALTEAADLYSLKSRLMALEARLGAFESRFAALETRTAQLEARAEAGLPTAVGGPGVAVRGAIQVGDREQAAPEKHRNEKKARRQEH